MELRKYIAKVVCEVFDKDIERNSFWKWFRDSKIIEDGKPAVCYHGSPDANIEIFDISQIGHNKGNLGHYGYGFYFSEDIREAKIYGNNIYKCYIRMVNPFYGNEKQILELKNKGVGDIDDLVITSIDFESFKESFKIDNIVYFFLLNVQQNGIEHAWNELFKKYGRNFDSDKLNDISNMIEYTTLNKNVDGVPDYVLDDLKRWGKHPVLNQGFPVEQSLHWITDLGNRSKYVTDVIKELGYDGVFYGSELVVFYPNQIKSVDNNGAWDINDNNIYH